MSYPTRPADIILPTCLAPIFQERPEVDWLAQLEDKDINHFTGRITQQGAANLIYLFCTVTREPFKNYRKLMEKGCPGFEKLTASKYAAELKAVHETLH